MTTAGRFPRSLRSAVFAVAATVSLPFCWGCGGGLPPINGGGNQNNNGTNGNTNDNGNGNTNGNTNTNTNDNTNGNDNLLQVRISGVPADPVDLGEALDLEAVVTGNTGELSFQWSAVPQEDAAISGSSEIVTLTVLGSGPITVAVTVTDQDTTLTAQDRLTIIVGTTPQPPAEAELVVLPVPPADPGQDVVLQAIVSGPFPESLTWRRDIENFPADPVVDLNLFDLGNGIATFTAPTLLTFDYTLHFVATATYANGGTLSRTVEVLIQGGPG